MLRKSYRDETHPDSSASQRVGKRRADGPDSNTHDYSDNDTGSNFYSEKEPLDFIVMMLETFVDEENVNFVFEYLPGQDLYWVLVNENNLQMGKQ